MKRRLYRLFLSPLWKKIHFFPPRSFIVLSHWVPQLQMVPWFEFPPLWVEVGFHHPILKSIRRLIIGFCFALLVRRCGRGFICLPISLVADVRYIFSRHTPPPLWMFLLLSRPPWRREIHFLPPIQAPLRPVYGFTHHVDFVYI